jgi:hypothetical protein
VVHGGFWSENPNARHLLGDLDVDGRIMLVDR